MHTSTTPATMEYSPPLVLVILAWQAAQLGEERKPVLTVDVQRGYFKTGIFLAHGEAGRWT